MNDVYTGNVVSSIAQDIHSTFNSNPVLRDSFVRFYGSMHEAAITGEVKRSQTYDLDILVMLPKITKERMHNLEEFFNHESSKFSQSSYEVRPSFMHGPIKLQPAQDKQKLLLHVMMTDPSDYAREKPYVKFSISKYGTPIYGEQGSIIVERIGLLDVLNEAPKRMSRLSTKKGYNWVIDENGKREVVHDISHQELLEQACYAAFNNTTNILQALMPYMRNPHFENSRRNFLAFKELFSGHSMNNLPIELWEMRERMRLGQAVDTKGVFEATLNFLAYNDQMLRNIIGNASQ